MASRGIVVIGGSSGALESLVPLLQGLPGQFGAAIFIVFHVPASSPGRLDRVLSRISPIPVHYAVDGESIRGGEVYLAEPDRHLLLQDGQVRVTQGPRENRFRPAIDPLFRTAAHEFGPAVVGIILSGAQADGAAGLAEIKNAGGVTIVQDPAECLVPALPEAALRGSEVDHVLSIADMARVLPGLVSRTAPATEVPMPPEERDTADAGGHDIHDSEKLGESSPFTCPDCGGTLWMSHAGDLLQFRCHVGHRFNGDALKSAQDEGVEQALWTAVRALEESSELRRRMAEHAVRHGMAAIAESYAAQAAESEGRAAVIRRVLMSDSVRLEAIES